jgi:microcystin-dependent protein
MTNEIEEIPSLTLFDESRTAKEGTKEFRTNAAYSWIWLAEHTKELNSALIKFNNMVVKTFEKADDINIDAEAIEKNIKDIEDNSKHIGEIVADIDFKFASLKEANQATRESLGLENIDNTSDLDKPISNATKEALSNKLDDNILIVEGDFVVPDDEEFVVKDLLYTGFSQDVQDVQAGEYRDFAMPNPKGRWLFCDGRSLSRTKYKELFEAIGTRYGKGDGVNTFNIPDRRGLFPRTLDAGHGMDEDSRRELGSYQVDEFKAHTHFSQGGTSNNWGPATGVHAPFSITGSRETTETGGQETRPKNISVYTCIRY